MTFLLQIVPYFSREITLGNIFTVITFLVAALMAWRDLRWRVDNLEAWKAAHEHSAMQAAQNIGMLRESIAKLTAIASGQERRLQMLEDRQHYNRKDIQ